MEKSAALALESNCIELKLFGVADSPKRGVFLQVFLSFGECGLLQDANGSFGACLGDEDEEEEAKGSSCLYGSAYVATVVRGESGACL